MLIVDDWILVVCSHACMHANVVEIRGLGLLGSDRDKLERQSLLRAVEFSRYLEGVLNVRFGAPRKACKFHTAVLNDPVVSAFGKKDTVRDGEIWVDASKGEPELEFRDNKLLQSYLSMIKTFPVVLEMAKFFPEFVDNQKKLSEQVAILSELLNYKPQELSRDQRRLYDC